MAARNYSALLGGERLSRNVGKEVLCGLLCNKYKQVRKPKRLISVYTFNFI